MGDYQQEIERLTFECTKRICVKQNPTVEEVMKKIMRGEIAHA